MIVAAFELRQVFEQNQPWWIGSGCCLNDRLGNSGFAKCVGPEYEPWHRAAIFWVKNTQVNQRAVLFSVGRPMRVVNGYNGIVHLVHLHSLQV